ncbi:hypothetical protein EDC04DRAFT_1788360 [Pisolithus marmoratus]|nr:hypothetical protein EDC04DRAFT_1788360 [Pisolithus marmoratus]
MMAMREVEQQQPRRRAVCTIHPFDLDAYIASYTGCTVIDSLITIITQCPSIAPHALSLVVQHLYRLRDPSLVNAVIGTYKNILGIQEDLEYPRHYWQGTYVNAYTKDPVMVHTQ